MIHLVVGTNGTKTFYYTGRAGQGWLSEDPRDAFDGFGEEGAKFKCDIFNKVKPLHGLDFKAIPQTSVQPDGSMVQ